MSPSAGVAAWQQPAKPDSGRCLKVAAVGAAALVLASYLAGFLFLWSLHADPRQATPLTVSQYGYYYGDRPAIRAGSVVLWRSRVAFVLSRLGRCACCRAGARCMAMRALPRAARSPRPGSWASEGIILGSWGGAA